MKSIHRHLPLLALVLLALAFRLDWYLVHSASPLFHSPAIDEGQHWAWAQQLAAGEDMARPYFRAPLYPWMLGLLADLGLSGVRLAGLALSLLTLFVLGQWAREEGGRGARLWLWLLGAVEAGLVYFAPLLLIPTLLLTLVGLASWMLCGAMAKMDGGAAAGRAAAGRPYGIWIGGIALGMAGIARPTVLPLVLPALWLVGRSAAGGGFSWKRGVLFLLCFLLPLAPVVLRNGWPASGVLIASQGGVNFWIGNNPLADGISASLPGAGAAWEREDTAREAYEAGVEGAGAESRWYTQRALEWITTEPLTAAALWLRKAFLLFESQPLNNNTAIPATVRGSPGLGLAFALGWPLLLFLGLGALIEGYPRRDASRRWILWVLLLQALLLVAFFVNTRFRMIFVPFLLLPAACWLAAAGDELQRPGRLTAVYALSLALATLLFGQPLLLVLPLLGLRLLKKDQRGWVPEAILHGGGWLLIAAGLLGTPAPLLALPGLAAALFHWLSRPIHRHPRRLAALAMALVLMEANPYTIARSEERMNHEFARQAFMEGNAWLRLEEAEKAESSLLAAIRLEPELREVRLNLGILAQQAGRLQEAMAHYIGELEIDPSSAKALNNLGGLYLRSGQEEAAVTRFRQALALRPGLQDARWNLGLALASLGLREAEAGDTTAARDRLTEIRQTTYRGQGYQRLLQMLGP